MLKDLRAKPILAKWAYRYLKEQHYAKTTPPVSYCFGLFKGKKLFGVCCFGVGANRNNTKLGCFKMIELNRFYIGQEGMGENALSQLVSGSLRLLEKPLVVISYADTNQGHVGYIYQATNWIYTGKGGG